MPIPAIRLLPALLIASVMAGCGTSPDRRADSLATAQPRVTQLEAAGDYAGLSQFYLGLQGDAAQKLEWRLLAAEALISGAMPEAALDTVAVLDESRLSAQQVTRLRLVRAQARLALGDNEGALQELPPYTQRLSPDMQRRVLQTRVTVFARTGRIEDELLDRLTLARITTDPDAQGRNSEEIWQLLGRIPEEQLLSLVSLDPELTGWVTLQQVARIPLNEPEQFDQQINGWLTRFPNHPARDRALTIQGSRAHPLAPRQVAVLLPLSGTYASAGNAVLAGLRAGLAAMATPAPHVIEYDTAVEPATSLYQRAVLQGSDMVIGPLLKDQVEALYALPQHPVSVLSLNRTTNDSGMVDNFYQFGLAPEDEAAQIATDALAAGWTRALAIYPADQWGARVGTAFLGRFADGGGTVTGSQIYPADQIDFTDPIKGLLQIDMSEARKAQLQRVLDRELTFEARRRQDADFVFLAGFTPSVRQIYPQLRFFGIGKLPVLSTSSAYSGVPSRIQDRDLDGLWFVDAPWLLSRDSTWLGKRIMAAAGAQQPQAESVADDSQADGEKAQRGPPPRLFALGADAINVTPWLVALKESPGTIFDGASGQLSVDRRGQLHRRLSWARFEDGLAVPRSLPQNTLQ